MQVTQELANLCSEMKAKYGQVLNLNNAAIMKQADRIVAATYSISCAALVVSLNQLAGSSKRKVVVDKIAIRLLAERTSGSGIVDKTISNIDQFSWICSVASDRKSMTLMNKFATELYHTFDDANVRLHKLIKSSKT